MSEQQTVDDAARALWRALCEGDGTHSEALDRAIIAAHLKRYAESGEPTPPATPQNDNMLSMRTHGLCSQSPATPQPETPERCQLCGGTVQAHLALDAPCRMFVGGIRRLSLSPPPDVERLKAYKRGFRDGFAAAQSWGCDMVEEALAAWSPSTPGEPT